MKQRRINATLKRALTPIAALALTALLILTPLPRAGTAAPRLERQPLESLTALNSTDLEAEAAATERGAPLSVFSVPSAASAVQSPGAATRVSAASRSSPVMFIENVGQFDEGALFQVRGGPGTTWLAEDAIWITVVERSHVDTLERLNAERTTVEYEDEPLHGVNLKLSFPGANLHPRIEPFDRLETVVSYFIGNDPAKWCPNVPAWRGVRYKDLYPGIDLEITSENGQMVQHLVVHRGADMSAVRLRIGGANDLALDGDRLHLITAVGDFTLPLLTAEGLNVERANVERVNSQTFEVSSPFSSPLLPHSLAPLQDNPDDLLYSTFLGGSRLDSSYGIAVDGAGSAYVAGRVDSSDFPTTAGAFDTSPSGMIDAFVVKLNPAGTDLAYATLLGGGGNDCWYQCVVAVDGTGSAYVTGPTSSPDFPTTPDAFDTTNNNDSFVVKLNPAGTDLAYGTFLGGTDGGHDYTRAIAVDGAGSAYVTGRTWSSDFPTTPDAFDTSYNGSTDAFVVKLNPAGTELAYGTFLGGGDYETGEAIAVDGAGSAYVTGRTQSADFPTTLGAFDTSHNGGGDAFVVKLNPAGTDLAYGTFLGSVSGGWGIAVDGAGSAYVAGTTSSSDFPTTPGAFDTTYNESFVVRFNTAGTELAYGTFLGGSGDEDSIRDLAVDGAGSAYVTGWTNSSDFPTTTGAFDTAYNGGGNLGKDAFMVKLNSSGSALAYATFLGGAGDNDSGIAIAVDGAGSAYIAGSTGSPDFPTTAEAFDTSCGTDGDCNFDGTRHYADAFVAKLAVGGGATPTKPPVVLVHGHRLTGITRCSDGVWEWEIDSTLPETFGEMARWLKEDGFDVWVAHYDTGLLGTPLLEKNAECLKDQIAYVRLVTGAQQVILVAHSMGGLVSRAYIEGPDYQYRNDVQALFTLGSPHAGIPEDWLKFLFGFMNLPSVCKGHEGLCQLEEKSMEDWNEKYGPKSHVITPLYYLIGGDKSDSFLGWNLRRWANPNDGIIGTRSAQALKDGGSAIQSDVKGRYQTHETHSSSWVLGYPSYFQPPFLDPTGQLRSQSYECIQNVILDMSNPCAEPSGAAMLAQAVPNLTEYTSDVRGHLNTGETAEHTLQVDADGASLFYLSWMTGTLGLTLTNPVGTVIDSAYAAANTDVVTYTTSPGSEMTPPFAAYAFTTTVPGLYTATITADDVGITGADYLLFAAMETTRTLSVALDSDRYQIGDTAVLTATLEGAGAGITGATVQATFSRSDAITDTLTLTDQGDGAYRGTYAVPNAPGYLHLRLTAEGSDAGTQFNRQVDRLLTVASQAVQLTGTYADRADDTDGNGRYETLTVDVEVLAAGAGDFTFSADLVAGDDQFVAHVITQTALITGTQSVPLSFDGDLIHDGESDGPFTVTNLLISDLQNAGIPSVMADDVWTTAAYDHTQFGRITGDMNGDCIVTVVDIMLVVSRWNTSIGDIRYDATYDQDSDGDIDVGDIMSVAAHWRETCAE